LLAQRFVGPLGVVLLAEVGEAALLGGAGGGGGTGGVGFESLVEAFVSAVLLGVGGLDEFGGDAEPDPPGGELGQAAEGAGGEGDAVVRADPLREPVLPEQAFKRHAGRCQQGPGQRVAGEQVAAVAVDDGEGIAVLAVAGLELAFEVGGPHGVRRIHRRGRAAGVPGAGAAAPAAHEAVALEELADGAGRGPGPARMAPRQVGEELPRSPRGMGAASREEQLPDGSRGPVRTRAGCPAGVPEAVVAAGLVPRDPLVPDAAAHTVVGAEVGHRVQVASLIVDEVTALGHRITHLPGHGHLRRGARG
jgi:hypothetical protein